MLNTRDVELIIDHLPEPRPRAPLKIPINTPKVSPNTKKPRTCSKPLIIVAIALIIISVTVSATLISYRSNTITAEVTVEGIVPLVLHNDQWTFDKNPISGGECDYLLVNITNPNDVVVSAYAELHIEVDNGTGWKPFHWQEDYDICIASSSGIMIYWDNLAYWEAEGYTNWRDWINGTHDLSNNWHYFDWLVSYWDYAILTQDIVDEYAPLYNGSIAAGNMTVDQEYPRGCFNNEMFDYDLTEFNTSNTNFADGIGLALITREDGYINTTSVPGGIESGDVSILIKVWFYPTIEPGDYRFSLTLKTEEI